jgi:hypothetical protein
MDQNDSKRAAEILTDCLKEALATGMGIAAGTQPTTGMAPAPTASKPARRPPASPEEEMPGEPDPRIGVS